MCDAPLPPPTVLGRAVSWQGLMQRVYNCRD